jgi:hypothetical protein
MLGRAKKISAYKFPVEKPEGKRPLERPTYRCEDNIKIHLKEMGCKCVCGLSTSGSG